MQGYLLEFALLCLCLLALGLWMMAGVQNRGSLLSTGRPRVTARPAMPQRSEFRRQPEGQGGRVTRSAPAPRRVQPRLLTADVMQTTEAKLATAISALYAISRGSDHSAAKIAERTLPRLQDYTEDKETRLALALHRLGVLALGRDGQSAAVAARALQAIEAR